ncbi:MAG TPA: pyridoxal phosphate-dependent aminotransferase [Candidatus Polarisedimenticolia bacterium]|nr:pyridoxal phosphate-dependent aminotransferase [Candidatus Polarisedimenticolia bacterium]
MFAARTAAWSRPPNRLARALESRRGQGLPVLDLTESNPTHCGLGPPGEAVLAALAGPASLRYDPDPRGMPSARAAVACDYARRGAAVDPDRLVLTASTSEAYGFLFRLLADPGSRVLVPAPSYPLFDLLAQIHDVALEPYQLLPGADFAVDLDGLSRAAARGAAVLLVVSPGNPAGVFLKAAEADAILSLAASHGIPVVCDEVFGQYGYGAGHGLAPTMAGRPEALTFTLDGLSKKLALPQLKLAWIAVGGPPQHAAEAMRRLEIIGDTYLSAGTPVQAALSSLLDLGDGVRHRILERVTANRAALQRGLSGHPGARLLPAEGGWSAVIRAPRSRPEEEWALALLGEDGVLVHPGWFFDFPEDGYLVASLLPEPALFGQALERLLARLARG